MSGGIKRNIVNNLKDPKRIVGVVLGLIIILSPFVSNGIIRWKNEKIMEGYNKVYRENESVWEKVEAYNDSLNNYDDPLSVVRNSEEYKEYGAIYDDDNPDGLIGFVDIDKVDVHLPIYLGNHKEKDGEAVLHVAGTSLPSKKAGVNFVISGHTGHPKAWLFTDLDRVEVGDEFSVTTLNLKFKYKVCKIMIVLPTETRDILPIEGKNCCTLITCTPFGINSHRLLVRGELLEVMPATQENQLGSTGRSDVVSD